jgi:hypothetical protein
MWFITLLLDEIVISVLWDSYEIKMWYVPVRVSLNGRLLVIITRSVVRVLTQSIYGSCRRGCVYRVYDRDELQSVHTLKGFYVIKK